MKTKDLQKLFATLSLVGFIVAGSLNVPTLAAQETKTEPSKNEIKKEPQSIASARRLNPTTIEVKYKDGQTRLYDFYGDNIFRVFQDNKNGGIRDPHAKPPARILVDQPRKALHDLQLSKEGKCYVIRTAKVDVFLDIESTLMRVYRAGSKALVLEETAPPSFEKAKLHLQLKAQDNEYFYGGGVQNGRFSHRGKQIAIVNENNWTDGGVASPAPYYWSTAGYGFMWHSFKPGYYDFAATQKATVQLEQDADYLDVFFMINDTPVALLNDYYQLTGHPVFLPKFAFYEGHLNAYNRDYWKEDEKGILFEDGKRYKESQKNNGGIRESLNGELKDNYPFSARAVIDRYKAHDMPLGWILPNDGYGAGYGQTETLEGNIENLRRFGDYARQNGVEVGLWTQSDLHPKEGISALLQRDIVREVRDAGVRVLKTDVAWVGAGYSFGLNGVADVAQIMPYYGNNARPFIISLDGWAGTQRYAAIWSGDQTGGEWEYIRFHIPTYIGAGLSGIPNITSDMDGIFGGKNPIVNARDFQWKTFTPMQLNMDGWGSNEKYPHALGEPTTSINRMYLKLKSELLPYSYSIAHQAIDGKPIMRAMFLSYPSPYTYGSATRYQFLYGPSFLVAPIYRDNRADEHGNDIRNGIYLPEGEWIDYFTGEVYRGEVVLNNFDAPIWKLPVFVKAGAIIPLTAPNNNVSEIDASRRIFEFYPTSGKSSFDAYDDDGTSLAYQHGESVTTHIESTLHKQGELQIHIAASQGHYKGFVEEQSTELRINITQRPSSLSVKVGGRKLRLKEVNSLEAFEKASNVYFYNETPEIKTFASEGSPIDTLKIIKNPVLMLKLEPIKVRNEAIDLKVQGYAYSKDPACKHQGTLSVPSFQLKKEDISPYTVLTRWSKQESADYYEILYNGLVYTGIKDTTLLFEDLQPSQSYHFQLRAVNKTGATPWSKTFSVETLSDPLEFAIRGITAELNVPSQETFGTDRLFDFAETGNIWHTKYRAKGVPCDLVMNLAAVYELDKFHYLPRPNAGNGTILHATVAYSSNKEDWTEAGECNWTQDAATKIFHFEGHPKARYIKLHITEGVGNYASGTELYVFKVPGSKGMIQGDINNDGKIDQNDLTSYANYTGLRKGDADFGGYISKGDINGNDLIDAYDISVVATRLEEGAKANEAEKIEGSIHLTSQKKSYRKGEIVELIVKGEGLNDLNAFSLAIPYDASELEYIECQAIAAKTMENMSYDRLHSNGQKALYPTFVNIGHQPTLAGDLDLCLIRFKAKRDLHFKPRMQDAILVDRALKQVQIH